MIHYANTSETKPEQYDEMFDVNIKCHFFLTQAAIPHLKQSKGIIINFVLTGTNNKILKNNLTVLSIH